MHVSVEVTIQIIQAKILNQIRIYCLILNLIHAFFLSSIAGGLCCAMLATTEVGSLH